MSDVNVAVEKLEGQLSKMEKQYEETQAKYNEAQKKINELEAAGRKQSEEYKSAFETLESSATAINELKKEIEVLKIESKTEEAQSLEKALEELLIEKKGDNKWGKQLEQIELKVSTADVVAPIHMTQPLYGDTFPRLRETTFIGRLLQRALQSDKGRVAYMTGEYASGAGYADEAANAVKEDSANIIEKSRHMAKVSAFIKISTEMFEDAPQVANQLRHQLVTKGMLFADNEIYSGDGNDDTAPQHFYGLKPAATKFDATKAGAAGITTSANIGDLVDAMRLQANVIDITDATKKDLAGYRADIVFVNPADALRWRLTKDSTGQYIIQTLADGSQRLRGLEVIESKALEQGELLVADESVIEFYVKRNMELNVAQIDKDALNDVRTLILFFRAQILVRDHNKYGLIHCPDVTAALTALETAQAGGGE